MPAEMAVRGLTESPSPCAECACLACALGWRLCAVGCAVAFVGAFPSGPWKRAPQTSGQLPVLAWEVGRRTGPCPKGASARGLRLLLCCGQQRGLASRLEHPQGVGYNEVTSG